MEERKASPFDVHVSWCDTSLTASARAGSLLTKAGRLQSSSHYSNRWQRTQHRRGSPAPKRPSADSCMVRPGTGCLAFHSGPLRITWQVAVLGGSCRLGEDEACSGEGQQGSIADAYFKKVTSSQSGGSRNLKPNSGDYCGPVPTSSPDVHQMKLARVLRPHLLKLCYKHTSTRTSVGVPSTPVKKAGCSG